MMDEAEVKRALDVSRETLERLEVFVAFLQEENQRQNLVSAASLNDVWQRHILDSAQLLRHVPSPVDTWLDLGTGAGFPGLIIAALHPTAVTLVEARKLRCEFLASAAEKMGLHDRVEIACSKVESFQARPFHVISARAFAPLSTLLDLGQRFATSETRWILPKGRNAKTELAAAESLWQGDFRLETSITDGEAHIMIAERVRRRSRERKKR